MADLPRILIAGSGPGALEAALALGASAHLTADVSLISPATEFVYRPNVVVEPFGGQAPARYLVGDIIAEAGTAQWQGTIDRVDPAAGRALSPEGDVFEFDALILATGTTLEPYLAQPAITFATAGSTEALAEVIDEIDQGSVRNVIFTRPAHASYSLPLYELALMSAGRAADAGVPVSIAIITPERAPLEMFGATAGEQVGRLCAEAGVSLVLGEEVAAFDGEQLVLAGGERASADRLVAMPRLAPHPPAGIPTDSEGFVPTAADQLVVGTNNVYAVGDITDFPVKQGGLAAAQARAAVTAIEAQLGSRARCEPFDGEIGGLLLSSAGRLALRARVTRDGAESLPAEQSSAPVQKIDSQLLAGRLSEIAPL